MGRRKNKFYQEVWYLRKKQSAQAELEHPPQLPGEAGDVPARIREKNTGITLLTSTQEQNSKSFIAISKPRRKATALHAKLVRISGLCALLNCVASLCSYLTTIPTGPASSERTMQLFLEFTVYFLATVQAVLVAVYWTWGHRYEIAIRWAVNMPKIQVRRRKSDTISKLLCAIEICYQLLVPVPGWDVQLPFFSLGKITYNQVLLALVLSRNYHSLRFFYWCSELSTARTLWFHRVANISSGFGPTARWFIGHHGLKFVLGLYGAMVILPGLAECLLERSDSDFSSIENGFWTVAITQATVGYGEIIPRSFPGQVAILVSCFFGMFTMGLLNVTSSGTLVLNETECTVYSELLYSKEKRRYEEEAVVLVQRWLRLMKNRVKRKVDVEAVMQFYTQLHLYKSVLVKCRRMKDSGFDRQLEVFELTTLSRTRSLNEYLHPVIHSFSFVPSTQIPDILRFQYRVRTTLQQFSARVSKLKLRKDCKRLCVSLDGIPQSVHSLTPRSIAAPSSSSERSGSSRARAKLQAFTNAKGRLAKRRSRRPISCRELTS